MLRKIFKNLAVFSCMLMAGGLMYGCGGDDGGAPPAASNLGKPSAVDPTNIQAAILGVSINSPPVVTFSLLDEKGAPLSPTTAGLSVRFTIAQLGADGNYKNYIKSSTQGQPGFDAGGTFAAIGTGVYTYTFKTDITDSTKTLGNLAYNSALTHTVAAQIQRGEGNAQQAANPYLNFRPAGGPVANTREVVAISNCNNCHESLRLHGGGRREIALCILCHYPGIIDPDTGNSIDMKSLVHKIHYGAKLPSNVALNTLNPDGLGFTIIGFNNTYNSYKTVVYPDFSNDGTINSTPADCVKCHQLGTNLTGQGYGKDVDKYKTAPTIAKCTTCHATISFDGSTAITFKDGVIPVAVTAVPHSGGPQADGSCAGCHPAGVIGVDDNYSTPSSIIGAHTVLEKSVLAAQKGPILKIVGVQNAQAGAQAKVTFSVKQADGTTVPFTGNSFALRIAYFPPDKLDYTNELLPSGSTSSGQPIAGATITAANATDNGDGTFTFTFPANLAIPVGLTGTAVITLDGRRGDIAYSTPHKGTVTTGRLSGLPDQWFFDLATGAQVTDTAKQRRKVVDDAKCLRCHDLIRGHGGSRVEVKDCVTCHNPNAVTIVTSGGNPFDFKYLIHKIHTGEDSQATVPFFSDAFKEVRFPGIKGNCLACHITDSYILPLKDGVIGTSLTTVSRAGATSAAPIANNSSQDTKLGPYASACTSCHDNPTVKTGHTDMMINNDGEEICSNCHVANSEKAVETVHPILK